MSTRRATSVIGSLFFSLLLLAGCEEKEEGYVTHGKVYMDKLVTLDSLFHNWKEFKGKVVTIRVKDVIKSGVVTTQIRTIDGFSCAYAIQWPTNINGLATVDDFADYARGEIDLENPPTYFDFGSYHLRFMSCSEGVRPLPAWIAYDGKVWSDYDQDEFGTRLHKVLVDALDSENVTISGVFVNIRQKLRPLEKVSTQDQIKAVDLVLTGVKYPNSAVE